MAQSAAMHHTVHRSAMQYFGLSNLCGAVAKGGLRAGYRALVWVWFLVMDLGLKIHVSSKFSREAERCYAMAVRSPW